ncbi:MAG: hypothetical protein WKF75_12310, partial [Singulisphaera sp.]
TVLASPSGATEGTGTVWVARDDSPDDDERPRRRLLGPVVLVLLPLVVLSVLVAWPRIRGLGRPEAPKTPMTPKDPVEQVAATYLEALVADDPLALNRSGTIAEPPAIRSFQAPRHDRGGDRDVRGSFAPIAALHARIDEDFTFDPKLGRFQPKNPLAPAAETLDALHAAKAKMEREKVYEKMASADLDEVVDSVTAFGKVFSDMAEGTLAPAKLLPTYAQLVEQSEPPLSPDAQELALDYATNRESWDALLKRPFLTLKADGPFRLERAEVTAPVFNALGSSGDPPTTLRLTLTRFRFEGIDTEWKVTSARREGDTAARDASPGSSTPAVSPAAGVVPSPSH